MKYYFYQKNVNVVFVQLNLDLHDIRFYAAKSSIERTTKEKEKSASDRSRQKEELKQRNIYLYTILEEIKLRPTTTKKEELLYELKKSNGVRCPSISYDSQAIRQRT